MYKTILGTILIFAWSTAQADGIEGKWRTETDDAGGYLEVTIGPCKSDTEKTCGIITNAFTSNGPDGGYKNLGKLIVMDMETKDGKQFSGGTIWDPEKDKTYKSKMTLKGDDLDVEGCISFICLGEDWKRTN